MNTIVVGTHVRHKEHPEYGNGRVRHVHQNGKSLAIEFVNPTNLIHDCAGHCKPNHGRWSRAESLDVVNPFKVGDTVRIADTPTVEDFYDPNFNGKTGKVIFVDAGTHSADVCVEGIAWSQWVSLEDLTLVKVDPVEAVKKAVPKARVVVFQSGSQCDRLVKHLAAGNSITPLVARQLFGVERLAARILEIKKAGHKVTSTIKTDVNGKVYAEYALRKAGRVYA
ncbi:hypothetical protein RHEph01_gp019 [Rhizobium phage RHEph01]|uniref:Winged helix-turn-helix domain-containing protein n=1 Tax=Rhizobium phage RHEph01 TaxID=1220601 RepID=L7TKA4_9CAUD|nr:hypothetical protein HOQ88_gp19 [Rhizobium phage RHEph01]AGC35530.1 hypothetical protein RHEph01_gp019 [Rhizobium phage RHEph01]